MADPYLPYERCAFATRLRVNRLYTKSHFWLSEHAGDQWRVGFTKFATRVLGEPVEFDIELESGDAVEAGQIIGWMEGFKAVTDLFCPMGGVFRGFNAALVERIELLQSDPFGEGWLYVLEGTPGDDCFDVHAYVAHLDSTIESMQKGMV